MSSPLEILDHATTVLRRGEALTLDAVAREAGLTKPGVVHHFSTKETLVTSVVAHIVDRWEAELTSQAPDATTPVEKLRAYVDYAVTGEFDYSDLALMIDPRIRDRLAELWVARLDPWFGDRIDGTPAQRASLRAARLLADGAWFNSALNISTVRADETAIVCRIAQGLIDQGSEQ
ncbi:TetR/AcrR family transcriptional regulator [Arthrobacter sp. CAN_A1]|uniref:TetR/AcrR family transcriptional regulator n=1 Tax=Arthrobacter sp. CAN_A1 TaxID=2787717 RepID=UPI0018C916E6